MNKLQVGAGTRRESLTVFQAVGSYPIASARTAVVDVRCVEKDERQGRCQHAARTSHLDLRGIPDDDCILHLSVFTVGSAA